MGTQDEYSIETPFSVGKVNNMSIIGGSSAYITGTITKRKGMVVNSYDTANGLTKWHLFTWDDVALVWVDLTNPMHTHTGISDGGEYTDIDVAGSNAKHIFYNGMSPSKGALGAGIAFAGTAAAVNDVVSTVGRIECITGTTTTGYANIFVYGVPINFGYSNRFNFWFKLSAITNLIMRWGWGAEDINGASDNNHKLGIEWCDAQATSNYYTLSANGSSRSLVDSGVALDASTGHGMRIVYFPASKAQYTFDNGTVYDKTAVLPTGDVLDENVIRAGVKNNNGGSATRTLEVRGYYGVGRSTATAWVST